MVVATRRTGGRRQKAEGKKPDDDRPDPKRVPGACVKTPGGLRAYVLGADPQNPGKVLIEYESRGMGEDSYQASMLTLVHLSPDTTAQTAAVNESKLDTEGALEAYKLKVVSEFKVGDRVIIRKTPRPTYQNKLKDFLNEEGEVFSVGDILSVKVGNRLLNNLKPEWVELVPTLPSTSSQQALTSSNAAIAPTQNSKLSSEDYFFGGNPTFIDQATFDRFSQTCAAMGLRKNKIGKTFHWQDREFVCIGISSCGDLKELEALEVVLSENWSQETYSYEELGDDGEEFSYTGQLVKQQHRELVLTAFRLHFAVASSHPSPLIPHPSDPLASLANQINELHSQGDEAEATAIAARSAALQLRKEEGDRLLEAKAQLKHGQWGKWLKANCPNLSERSCQLYMQIAEGWDELIAKNETVADLGLREAIALLPKKTKVIAFTPEPSPLDYTPLPEPKPVWFQVGNAWTEGQAIAQSQHGFFRIAWGEERESDIPGGRVWWTKPDLAVAAAIEADLEALGWERHQPSSTPTASTLSYTPTLSPPVACQLCQHRVPIDGVEADRYWCEQGEFDDTLRLTQDWAKDCNEGICKSFVAADRPLYKQALAFEQQAQLDPPKPTVRLKVKRRRGKGKVVEVMGAIVQISGVTHYLQLEDLQMEDF